MKTPFLLLLLIPFNFAFAMQSQTTELAESMLDNPEHAVSKLQSKLNYLISSHEYGNELMGDFDKALELGTDSKKLFGSKTYRDLLALHLVKKDAVHEFADLIRYMEAAAKLTKRKDTSNFIVSMTMNTIKATLETPKNKVALSDLIDELAEDPDSTFSSLKYNVLDYLDKGREIKSVQKNESYNQVLEDVKKTEKEWEQVGRDPSSFFGSSTTLPKIEPSSGKNGNILGYEYPDGTWSLTFDDGPSTEHTPVVLKNLKDAKLKATFFALAQNLSHMKEIALNEKSEGHTLANHSFSHAQLTKLGSSGLDHEIRESTVVDTNTWGVRPEFFRCPYGAGNGVERIRRIIAEEKMIHVFWNVDTLDWQDKNPMSVYNRAIKQMTAEKHGVILFHDIHPQSVVASKMVMEYLNKNKLKAVTLKEAVEAINASRK